jgi:ribosomal protein L24
MLKNMGVILSNDPNNNIKVEGANPFTYEYTFRLHDNAGSVSHIYPFISKEVVTIEVHTFDFDNDGWGRIVSVAKKSEQIEVSGDNHWITSKHQIIEQEKNTSLDIQLIKKETIKNNNVVFYIKNQYGTLLPFYPSPIGGVPKYSYKIGVRPQR